MPSIQQMRNELYLKYKGNRWKQKVLAMADDQIIAIWYSFQKRVKPKTNKENVKQLRLFKE